MLGYALYLVAALMLVGVVYGLSEIIDRFAGRWSQLVNELFKQGAKIFAAMGAIAIGYLGKKLTTRSANELLRKDPRPPVLYLRSFGVDDDQVNEKLRGAFWKETRLSVEEQMASELHRIGPVVAIGRPGERLPTLGAARVYVADADWQDVVTQLATHAALLVLRVGETAGFWWELERAAKIADGTRVVLFLPSTGHDSAAGAQAYDRFRTRADVLLPHPLPPSINESCVIHFDAKWSPIVQESVASFVDAALGPPPARKPRRGFILARVPILDAIALGFLIPIGIILIVWLVIFIVDHL